MRVIAGQYRGTRLDTPRGVDIRPTADRLRESIFNIIGQRLPGKRVLDLFAGTGAMGIEALSRGASQAVFIDHLPKAIDLIHKNVAKVRAGDLATIISWDIARDLRCLCGQKGFDYIFLDPPYRQGLVQRALYNLRSTDIRFNLIVVEHYIHEPMGNFADAFVLQDQRRYGKTLVSFLSGMV
jgi:16S rRNA (guanine966-N2)-methyltransferase